ncbi:hypothetical protein ACIGEZ_19625 [Streptomyces sp. NPDC085481]|uniref:hypothetical protein n=1 Tax=Streptomyces sp. NPDC085481 TaxID=3365727 RepID=UPI0037D8DFBB
MRTIETLLPQHGKPDVASLRGYDADDLARYILDPDNAWWRRRLCVHALGGRVPEARVAGLLGRIRDRGETGEVRIALLDLLADRSELLPWLRHEDRRDEPSYGMPEAILKARGLLGDRTAARDLATLAHSPWQRTEALGEAGLDALVERYGVEAVLADLGGGRPEDRAFAVRMRHRAGQDVTGHLADPDRAVAHLAESLVADRGRLLRYLDEAPTTEAAVRAACALHRLAEDPVETRAIDARLGSPRVEVPGLDEELRRPIVHAYAPGCQRQSDPRWRLEALCTEPPARPDQEAQLARATAALTAAGLAPAGPVPCGEHRMQGDGTFHVYEWGDDEVHVSTLGRFATGYEDDHAARRPLEGAGFRWIDAETSQVRVTDLCVYYFGHREPLDVGDLLFYWQD